MKRMQTKRFGPEKETPDWVIDMNKLMMEGIGYASGRSWTIYRVPKNMCDVNRSSFIPKIISIGPFHYGEKRLHVMEEHKKRYLFRLLGFESQSKIRLALPTDNVVKDAPKLESLAGAMKLLEEKTRDCYSETFNLSSDDFVQMMVMDGCFVVELLRLYHKFEAENEEEEDVEDPIFTTRWMLRTLQRDLLMLENQLPFFVLEKLFEITSLGKEPSLMELTLEFFNPLMPREKELLKVETEDEISHLLDLYRTSFLSSVVSRKSKGTGSHAHAEEGQLIHCATELQEARVTFMKTKDSDLFDIQFKDGLLKIPILRIDDNTVPMFLNFVAHEQCDEDEEPYFTHHFMFLDSLVNAANDVSILHKNGIINHVLGSDKDIATFFNKLGREIVYDVRDSHLATQMKAINKYYRGYSDSRLRVWWTNLISNYFSSPWTFLSPLAAIILLLLTVTQTLLAAYAYYKPIGP
ncbi:hypothetical protein ACHQM5_013740 [Ranunculus cassubicifolius]